MQHKWLVLPLLVVVALTLGVAAIGTFAQDDMPETPVPSGERDSVSLTVYNQGTALVQDRRTFTFETGTNLVNFTDVAATIDATSVSFNSLTDSDGTVVLEQNYVYDLVDTGALLTRYIDETIEVTMMDGTVYVGELLSGRSGDVILRDDSGQVTVLNLSEARDVRFPELPSGLITRPTLRWLVNASQAGDQQVELTYLAGGMNWTADYNVLLATDNSSLDLNGWVTVTNNSGTAYADAQLKLVAGDVNRIQAQRQEFAFEDEAAMDVMPTAGGAPVQQREFFEYQLYEITRRVTIGSNETKQVEFVTSADVPATTYFVYDASTPFFGYNSPIFDEFYGTTGITNVRNFIEFSTGEDNGLGADLPAGRVRVYQEDTDGAALLIGENRIDHTPMGETVQFYLGNAFDLVGERTQTDYIQVSSRVIQETYEIRLRNRKDNETVEIRVPERLFRWSDWEILGSSTDFTQLNSNTIEFRVDVPPGGETVITYTVQYTFPR